MKVSVKTIFPETGAPRSVEVHLTVSEAAQLRSALAGVRATRTRSGIRAPKAEIINRLHEKLFRCF